MERFAFLAHPFGPVGLSSIYPWTRYIPGFISKPALSRLSLIKTAEVGDESARDSRAAGWLLISSAVLGQLERLPKSSLVQKIVRAGLKARRMGAGVFGCGTYSSCDPETVKNIAQKISLPVITGRALGLAAAVEGIKAAAAQAGLDLAEAVAAVIGGDGPVGSVFAELLARETKSLILIGNNQASLKKTANKIFYHTGTVAFTAGNPADALKTADVVVTDPHYPNFSGLPGLLKPKAIVCDISCEGKALRQMAAEREDLVLTEGGLIRFPPGLPVGPFTSTGPAFAETYLAAMEGKAAEFSCGAELTVDKAVKIARLAKKYGFRVTGFKQFLKTSA